jgi:hypothetical protein
MIKCYNEKIWDIETLNYMLFAGVAYNKEVSDSDYHKSIFDSDILLNVFKDNNIAIINLELDPVDDLVIDPKSHNLNIKILGIKQ